MRWPRFESRATRSKAAGADGANGPANQCALSRGTLSRASIWTKSQSRERKASQVRSVASCALKSQGQSCRRIVVQVGPFSRRPETGATLTLVGWMSMAWNAWPPSSCRSSNWPNRAVWLKLPTRHRYAFGRDFARLIRRPVVGRSCSLLTRASFHVCQCS